MNYISRNTSTGLRWEEICKTHSIGVELSKHKLYRYLKNLKIDWKSIISKKLLPDEAYLEENKLIIYEKKFQQVAGSVDEKLQTCDFKIRQYRKIANAIGAKEVEYIYLLNNWFSKPEYKDALDYINSIQGCSYRIIEAEV